MGSGSSKKSQQPAKKPAPPRPVANVNKQDPNFLDQSINDNKENDVGQNDKNSKRRDENENYTNKKQEKAKEKENKKMKMEKPRENMLTFEEDSDIDNDIDEVLKMPMAIEYPKPKKKDKKAKKNKEEVINNYDQNLDRDLFNSNPNGISRSEDLPETYAQRLQRQQYKLQQEFLIRQKTMHRNSREWDDFDQGDENENLTNQGFDASKFRAVNKGTDVKKDLFKTAGPQEDLETPRYLQTEPGMDDFQVSRRPPSPKTNLPSYNQSEIDLMNELERDLL